MTSSSAGTVPAIQTPSVRRGHEGIDALVVGAGFAGLSAATALAEQGARVLVLEARPSLGGRATAFTDPVTGERVDNGQHVLLGCYHETFRFLRRIGTEADVWLQRDLQMDVVDRRGRSSRLACPALPAPFHLLAGLMRWSALGWRDRLAALRMGRRPSPRSGETARRWLERLGQTPRLIELLWEPLAVASLNEPIDVASAAPLAVVLDRVLAGRRDVALGLARTPLDQLYALPARAFVEALGGQVRQGVVAEIAVVGGHEGESTAGVPPSSNLSVRAGDEVWAPHVVIAAVGWYALPSLFTPRPAQLAATLESAERTAASPIVTVNLWFDRPVSSAAFVGLPGRTMQWVFDKRALFGASTSHLSLVSSGAGAIVGRSNQDLTDVALDELRAALPAAREAVLLRSVVVREKRATFSVAPGQPSRPATVTGVAGLFLAGDWIDTGLPATIEGAVVSGHRAAAEALTCLAALPRQPAAP